MLAWLTVKMSEEHRLLGAGVQTQSLNSGLGLNLDIIEIVQIKEEPEEQGIKQEEEQLPVCALESSAVCVNREDFLLLQQRKTQHKEETQGENISSGPHFHSKTDHSSPLRYSAQTETEVDGGHYNKVQTKDGRTKPSSKCKSAPKTKVNNGLIGAEGAEEEKKHQCPVCRKIFGRKDILKRHSRIHTGERPYTCTICNKAFTQKTHLDYHVKTHRADITFNCSICQMDFTDSSSLQEHLKMHTAEPSSCLHSSPSEQMTTESEKELCCSKDESQWLLDSALSLMDPQHSVGVQTPQIKEEPAEQGVKQETEQQPMCASETSTTVNNIDTSGVEITERKKYQCTFCEKTYTSKHALDRHTRLHTGERPYRCAVCDKTFVQGSKLTLHMRTHTGDKPFSCSFCQKTFTQKTNLKTHMRIHTGEKPYSCSFCKKEFSDYSSLKQHARTHTGERPFRCSICSKTFAHKPNLNSHLRTHAADITFNCSICEMDFTDASSLKEHLNSHTEVEPSSSSHPPLFERMTAESKEEQCVSKEKTQRKPTLMGTVGVQTLQIKEDPEEQSVKQEEEQLPVFVPESRAVCVKREELSLLQQKQTDETPEEDISSETEGDTEHSSDTDHDWEPPKSTGLFPKYNFAAETSATINSGHMSEAEVAEKKKHQCPFCQKRFWTNPHLQTHIRIHLGERPYSCSVCETTFVQKVHLKVHMRTHTGDKPYSCSICQKAFVAKCHLKIHMRTHTGEKPYRCSICFRTFSQRCLLQSHTRTHTGEKPFSCPHCEKAFAHKSNLRTHVSLHTGVKPYSCSLCEKAFIQKSHLKFHMSSTHRGADPAAEQTLQS